MAKGRDKQGREAKKKKKPKDAKLASVDFRHHSVTPAAPAPPPAPAPPRPND